MKPCLMGEIYTKYHYEYYKTEQWGVRELKRQMKSMLFLANCLAAVIHAEGKVFATQRGYGEH